MTTDRRLLVICHGLPPYYGGGERAAWALAAAAARAGWRVDALTSDLGGRLPPRETVDGIDVRRVPARKKEWTNHSVPELLSFLLAALRYGSAIPPLQPRDRILAHFSLPSGWVARALSRRDGAPYGVVLHGSDVPGHQPGRFGRLYPLATIPIRRVWQDARSVFAVSAELKDRAEALCPGLDAHHIPNGVDPDIFQPLEHPPSTSSKDWNIVCVAQFVEVKGHRFLFDALEAWNGPPDWTLHLYGSGPDGDALRREADRNGLRDRVLFHGIVDPPVVAEALRQADVFVLPSSREGLPLSVLEAMASGCPVVATCVGDVPDLIEDEVHGLLVPSRDPGALRSALERLVGDAKLRARLARRGRERAREFSWNAIWRRYENILTAEPGRMRSIEAALGLRT